MRYSLLAVLFLIFAAVPAYASVEEEAAAGYCKCVQPMLDKVKDAQSAMKGGDMSAVQGMLAEMQALEPKIMKCSSTLEAKYSDKKDDEAFQSAVAAEIEKRCPAPKLGMGG